MPSNPVTFAAERALLQQGPDESIEAFIDRVTSVKNMPETHVDWIRDQNLKIRSEQERMRREAKRNG